MNDRLAWLAWRRQGIGASDAPAIAGMDPFRGPMAVWLDKSGRLPLDDGDAGEYRRWGNLLEPAIMDEFSVRTGLFLPQRGLRLEHREFPWMRATLDAVVAESVDVTTFNSEDERIPGSVLGVLEVKTVAGFKSSAWSDGIPENFQLQVQHQLAVSGLERAWVAVLFGGQRMEIMDLERDDEVIASLVTLEQDFWDRHVLAGVPPAGDGSAGTTEALRRAFRGGALHGKGDELSALELPEAAIPLLAMRVAAKVAAKDSERVAEQAEQALMAILGDHEVGLLEGRPAVTWKRQSKTVVDLVRLRAADPELVERHTSKNEYRVFRLAAAFGKED